MTDPRYFIELRGCNFKNKGDVLMAESVIARMQENRPDIRLVCRTFNRRGSLASEASLGKCFSPRHSDRRSALKAAFLSALATPALALGLEKIAGIRPASKLAGIIDVCGFSYGDAWGPGALEADYRLYSEAADAGKSIILMPKSFGPFSGTGMAEKVRSICQLASLCLVRDPVSFQHLLDAGVPEASISLYPDFTSAATPIALRRYAKLAGRPAIIPNYRMIDAGKVFTESDYVEFLSGLYRHLETRYGKPFLLVHDTGRDPLLAQRIAAEIGGSVETVMEPMARANKGIISSASFVYSDRLHGAISAALEGVPVSAMGWSHKYRYMLQDFGLEWALIQASSSDTALLQIEGIMDRYDANDAAAWRAEAERAQARLRERNEGMWHKILAEINRCHPVAP